MTHSASNSGLQVDTSEFVNTEGASLAGDSVSFSFGANWAKFLRELSDDTINQAVSDFCTFSRRDSLRGETFLDIGSGSGLSSLVAQRLTADRILSLDVDPNSVACTQTLRGRYAPNCAGWEVRQGSVLDESFVASLGKFSYVYSWGVLHHTGAMWRAVEQASSCVAPNGHFHVALYNWNKHSAKFHKLKRLYNRLPGFAQRLMVGAYGLAGMGYAMLRLKSPLSLIRDKSRGMRFWRDMEDWLGGLPYEYCRPEEVLNALAPHGFTLRGLTTTWSIGCNEFLFVRDGGGQNRSSSAPTGSEYTS